MDKQKYPDLTNYINGQKVASSGSRWMAVVSPLDGSLLSRVPMSNAADLDSAVQAAAAAQAQWAKTPIKVRVQVFFKYKTLLEQHIDALSELVHTENGKTLSEARAEVEKSIELTEFACSLPQLVQGEILEVSAGVECRTERYHVGVVASIAPFIFPNMVPN